MYPVELKNVYRIFRNKKQTIEALNNISLRVRRAEIFGILGPNGAGKTTLIKIMSTMLLPSKGNCKIMGLDVVKEADKIRPKINFVYGGEKGMYGRLTAQEYLTYFCYLYKIPNYEIKNKVNKLLQEVNLNNTNNLKIWKFSKGMIERLHIARSLINKPKIVFLDEPTVGLDPDGARLLKNLIVKMKNDGLTIIYTTHYMPEADYLCDRVAFLKEGSIREISSPKVLKEKVKLKVIKVDISSTIDSNIWKFITKHEEIVIINVDTLRPYRVVTAYIKKDFYYKEIKGLVKQDEYATLKELDINLEDAYSYFVGDIHQNVLLNS